MTRCILSKSGLFMVKLLDLDLGLTISGAQGVTMSVCRAKSVKSSSFSFRSVSGLLKLSLSISALLLVHFFGHTEPKILRLVTCYRNTPTLRIPKFPSQLWSVSQQLPVVHCTAAKTVYISIVKIILAHILIIQTYLVTTRE